MDADGIVMKLSILVILAVLGFFVWKWWNGAGTIDKFEMPMPPPVPDPIPQEPGIIVYGTESCPWCVKQKEYLDSKSIEYTFVNCDSGKCPSFVNGYPTIVKDGQMLRGYQEL